MASSFGTNTSMGVSGTSGLDWNTIDSLRKQEEETRLTPITKKLQTNIDKQTELTSLKTLLTTLQSSFKTLSDYSTFQKRKTNVEGSGVTASAGEGLAVQDIKLNVSQLAQNDVNQVGQKYAARDSIFSRTGGNISFYHDGTSYNVRVQAGQTLEQVAQSITDATGGAVKGIIMKTGGDNPYQLMVQTENTGEKNRIYFGSSLDGAAVPGGQLKSGEFKVEIGGQSVSIDLAKDVVGSTTSSSSKDNAKAVVDAILKKIEDGAASGDTGLKSLKDQLDSGQIHINVNSKGTGILLNDSTGRQIKVETNNTKVQAAAGVSDTDTDLGFSKKQSVKNDQVVGTGAVNGGLINGKIVVAGVNIDLSTITKAGNTGNQNAQAFVDLINNDATLQGKGITAKYENNRLVLNDEQGDAIEIAALDTTANGTDMKALSALGLQAGSYLSESEFMQSAFKVTNIQTAQDAKFKYNGMDIQRDKNNIDDVVSGLSLELTAVTEKDKDVIVRVSRDDTGISDEIDAFVKAYNEVVAKIAELTRYDEDTEIAGPFNGSSELRTIRTQLNQIINSSDINGKNLVAYGVYIGTDSDGNATGQLKFDKEKFDEAYADDPNAAIEFFRSKTTTDKKGITTETPGIFSKLRDVMDGLITGDSSVLGSLEADLKTESDRLNEQKTSTTEMLDTKYDLMAVRFSAADQQIYAMQAKFQSLSMAIQSAMSS